ncbi:hypothetical protein A2890_01950 [candidate division WWE3 bacterium RIFCSPLOWO2_01_FULL_53_14]|uniref:Uncharacterized protein n=1 Tax=candidate division WWE3 bacterium RIFCSPLOWO2_01_FULL_53_14 TaxID=1802628 RepID=A0A1F4VYV3_UNCKA|nr:MAG: hypothetical protein A2890_01950 [candidate division WWE3 bacterium RIFCSPLOWO2_01_FULL_53_14]
MTGDEFAVELSDKGLIALVNAAERLLKSDHYYARLRRVLTNGIDPKVLTDFLVLDDVVLAVMHGVAETSDVWAEFKQARIDAFLKARESAERKLDVREHDRMLRLHDHLLGYRNERETAEKVLDAVYGPPRKGKVY